MTYQPTDDDRRRARERVAARQARRNQNTKQSTAGNFTDKISSSLRSSSEALSSRVSNRTNRRSKRANTPIEDDFQNLSYEEMYGLDDNFASNIVERDVPQADPYAEIPRNYNRRPSYNRGEYSTRRPVQIHGQNEIMRPSQGQTSVRIPLIGSESVGSKQLSFSGGQNKIKTIILIVVALVLLFAIGSGITNCVSSCSAPQEDPKEQEAKQPTEGDVNRQNINKDGLVTLVGESTATKLVDKAQTNDDVAWIAAHYTDYAQLGDRWQTKLLELASNEDEAVPYVRGYLSNFPAKEASGSCAEFEKGTVPNLYQWDTRWGWYPYSQSSIGMSGCGPTAVAMAYQGVTGKNDKSPYDIALDAEQNGFIDNGTSNAFYDWEADNLGISCHALDVSASDLREALNDGAVVICNVGPGDFTQVGHFIVLAGIDSEGNIIVNDPFSANNSAKTWSFDTVLSQTKALWAYTA